MCCVRGLGGASGLLSEVMHRVSLRGEEVVKELFIT